MHARCSLYNRPSFPCYHLPLCLLEHWIWSKSFSILSYRCGSARFFLLLFLFLSYLLIPSWLGLGTSAGWLRQFSLLLSKAVKEMLPHEAMWGGMDREQAYLVSVEREREKELMQGSTGISSSSLLDNFVTSQNFWGGSRDLAQRLPPKLSLSLEFKYRVTGWLSGGCWRAAELRIILLSGSCLSGSESYAAILSSS